MKETILFVGGFVNGERREISHGESYLIVYRLLPPNPSAFDERADFLKNLSDYIEKMIYERRNFRFGSGFSHCPVEVSVMAPKGMTHADVFQLLVTHYHPPKT